MNFGEVYSTIAFYGISPSPKTAENLYHCLIDIFNRLGHLPDKIGIGASGFGEHLTGFPRTSAKLLRRGFSGIQDIELCSTLPDAKFFGCDCYCSASFSIKYSYVRFVTQKFLADLSNTSLIKLAAAQIINHANPGYGIGYYRQLQYGPGAYAVGLNQGGPLIVSPEVEEQKRHVSRWADTGMQRQVYRLGLIRDVYPWNFLTAPQLERSVNGVQLQRWIKADASRGKLSSITDSMMLWEVEDAQIPVIRPVLWDAGVIFDWRKYIDDDPSAPLSPEESLQRVLEGAQSKGVGLEDLQVLRSGSGKEVPAEELKKILKKPRNAKKK